LFAKIKKSIQWGSHTLTLETGKIARQSHSILVSLDDTTVLTTVVGVNDPNDVKDFLPMRVDYSERAYSGGRIPGGFFKREGRPSEREILVCRLIDRPLRPLFPKGFGNEVQISATVMSLNPMIDADIPAMIGASAAVAISGIPFNGPMGASRVGYIDNDFVLNPSSDQLKKSKLDLVVAGDKSSVLMVESEAELLPEEVMLDAVLFGHKSFAPVIDLINELAKEVGNSTWNWQPKTESAAFRDKVKELCQSDIAAAYEIKEKPARLSKLSSIRDKARTQLVNLLEADFPHDNMDNFSAVFSSLEKELVRSKVLAGKPRIDGRDTKTVRPIDIETGLLQRTHGSSLFTRGETQALVTVTLGTSKDAQITDSPIGEQKEPFMLHYNFPPYCVGEIGPIGSPKRREIGHGNLAKRGIKPILPKEDFPYVVRIVSEITESNGSSSMASVCGSSLALMDAGIPLNEHVAGVAMGLIKEGDDFAVITDILGDEDHLGDMDFKVAGTSSGVSALQMDIKIPGITPQIMKEALLQAKEARLHILEKMQTAIAAPRGKISKYAPQISTFKINPDKIRDVIGKGGATIRALTEETGAVIELQDDGTVQLSATNEESASEARRRIDELTAEVEVGKIYTGKVIRTVDFGAFVNIMPGRDGLVHISQIADHRVDKVTDELSEGQVVKVKVIEIDRQGRVRLSMKSVSETESTSVT